MISMVAMYWNDDDDGDDTEEATTNFQDAQARIWKDFIDDNWLA